MLTNILKISLIGGLKFFKIPIQKHKLNIQQAGSTLQIGTT